MHGGIGVREAKCTARTIHDGTVNDVNPWIQKNILEHTAATGPADLHLASRVLDMNIPFAVLKMDICFFYAG